MFNSSRGPSHDRRSRRASIRKAALSSRGSLFSGVTTSSGGSSGSGSTITQESVSRSRRAARANASLVQNKEQAAPLTIARRQSTGSTTAEGSPIPIDVFAFLEHDPSRPSVAEPDANSHNAVRQIHNCTPLQEESDLECSARSLHSDSGISIRDSSPESLHHRSYSRSVLDPLREEDPPYSLRHFSLKSHQHHSSMRPGRDNDINVDVQPRSFDDQYFDGAPETFYRDHGSSDGLMAAGSVQAASNDSTADLSGYELLAARLSDDHNIEHPFRPLYRKFARLNHRILLQLQDEISQMEADLASLDAADAKSRRGSTGQIVPESRRLSWQGHGSELQTSRLELLGQIYVKVEQYSKLVRVLFNPSILTLLEDQALTSFQKVRKGTTSASQSDVQRYRSWMKSSAPVAEVEQRFLDEPDDLLAFCAHKSCPTCGNHATFETEAGRGIMIVLVILVLPSTLLFFLSYPRMGIVLLVCTAIALYPNRDDAARAVASYLQS